MSNPVLRAITNPLGDPALDIFLHWCDLRGVKPIPTSPVAIARFVIESQALGIDKVAATLTAISQAYISRGLADPTAGPGPVAAAVSQIAPVTPPRAWKAFAREAFQTFPHELQVYLAGHELEREKVIRRSQNEAAAARKELEKLQSNTKDDTNGNQQDTTATA
jgi:hypothetical protein